MPSAPLDRQFITIDSPTGFPTAAFGARPLQGVYVTPSGKRPTTAFIAAHVNLDFTEHYLGPLLAERGYGFLGWNTRFRGNEQHFLLDHAVAEIGAGVNWLRAQAGVERVVLIGNSGGGALMAAYQAQALQPHLRPAPNTPPVRSRPRSGGRRPLHLRGVTPRTTRPERRVHRPIRRRRERSPGGESRPRHVRRTQRPKL